MLPKHWPDLSASVVLQKTHWESQAGSDGGGGSGVLGFILGILRKRVLGLLRSAPKKRPLAQAVALRVMLYWRSWPPRRALRSLAAARSAEKRNGMPKLDSGGMLDPLGLANVGGGEHWLQLALAVWIPVTMASSGFDCSLFRVRAVPSSHETVMARSVSPCLTHRVVVNFAWTAGGACAARPVWQTPPGSSVVAPDFDTPPLGT